MSVKKIKPAEFQIDLFDPVDEAITQLSGLQLRVGWFEGAKYDDDTSVVSVAYDNEYGVPSEKIPPRPFMRPTIKANREKWKKFTLKASRRIINGKSTGPEMLEAMGQVISGQIRKAIRDVQRPELAPFTIEKRLEVRADKRTMGLLYKPLVFEGLLLNSVSYIVNDNAPVQPFDRWEAH